MRKSYIPEHFQDDSDDDDTEPSKRVFCFQPQHMTPEHIPPETTHLLVDCSQIANLGLYPKDSNEQDDWQEQIQQDHRNNHRSNHHNNNKMVPPYQHGLTSCSVSAAYFQWGPCSRPYKWQSMLAGRDETMKGIFLGQNTDIKHIRLIQQQTAEAPPLIIGPFCFAGCNFKDIEVPPTLIRIGPCAFAQCRFLVDVQLSTNNTGLERIEDWAFFECESLRQFTVPSTVTRIGNHAFDSCHALVDLRFGQGSSCLQEIQEYAFWKCHSLCAVSIPSSTVRLGKCAFADCTRLLGVELFFATYTTTKPLELGRSCFAGCYNLVHLCLPSWTKIESLAFAECPYKSQHFLNRFIGDNNKLSVHSACYYASSLPNAAHLIKVLIPKSLREGQVATDALGMTPFHILATSASLRLDLLQLLLEEYSWQVLSLKDKKDKTVMDYLLLHQSPGAVPMIQLLLKHLITVTMSLQWRGSRYKFRLLELVQESKWDQARNAHKRRQVMDNLLQQMVEYTKVESTSILEEALWKGTILSTTTTITNDPLNAPEDRQHCRVVCNANIVLANVVPYLWEKTIIVQDQEEEDKWDDDDDDDELPPCIPNRRTAPKESAYKTEELPPEISWLQGEVMESEEDDWDMW